MERDDYIRMQASECRQRIREIEQELKGFPEGDLHCYKNHNGFITRVSMPGRSDVYLPKSEKTQAERLARKTALEAELKDLCQELFACEQYLTAIEDHPHALEYVLSRPGMMELLGESQGSWSEYARNWMKEPYEKLERYSDRKIVSTITGDYVRSKSEALCVQLFCELHIPFRYEQKWEMGGREYYPDFTVLRPRDGDICLIELFGMMGDDSYIDHTYEKLRIYARNGWVPGQNLFCFYESDGAPLDTWFVRKTLRHFFLGKS